MKLLLLQPLVPSRVLWGKFAKGEGFVPPIGLLNIAAFLREAGYFVMIKDSQVDKMTENDLELYLKENRFDVIGIPTFTNSIAFSYATAKICKKALPNCQVVLGGVHATTLPERTLRECAEVDFIILGEGEYRFESLLRHLKNEIISLDRLDGVAYRSGNKIVVNEMKDYIADLGKLPLPAYDLLDMLKYIPHPSQYKYLPNYPVVIQRGCPYNCSFCAAHTIHGKIVRFKPVEKVIEELKILKKQYGARGVYFQDSTFLINKKYIAELLNRLIEEKLGLAWACNTRVNTIDKDILKLMKKAGCWMIDFGIESGNQKSLDLMKKGVTVKQNERAVKLTEKNGIIAFCTYILALPGENYEDSLNTIKFSLKLRSTMAMFYLPVPYPGTELINIAREYGGLREDAIWEDYSAVDFSSMVYVNPLIGKEKMLALLKLAYRKYYTNPIVIMKNLLTIRSFSALGKYYRAFMAVFGS